MLREYTLPLCLLKLCSDVPIQITFLKEEGSFLIGPRVPHCLRGPGESPYLQPAAPPSQETLAVESLDCASHWEVSLTPAW